MQGASPLASPGLNPGGTGAGGRITRWRGGLPRRCRCCPRRGRGGFGCRLTLPLWCLKGGLPSLPPAYPAFSCPLSPRPPSPARKGETQSLFRRGLRPRLPGVEPAVTAKPTEFLYLEQCRQPRRGGTGGDGTIRRTRRRRLRWSSPPGQGEPMPHRFKPDSKPAAEAAKPILQNPKSQPPSDTARKPQVRAPT